MSLERGFARGGLEDLEVRIAERVQRRVQQAQDIALIVNQQDGRCHVCWTWPASTLPDYWMNVSAKWQAAQ